LTFESTQDQSDTDLLYVIKAHRHHQNFAASTTGIHRGILQRIHLGVMDRGLFYRPIHSAKAALQKRRRRRRRLLSFNEFEISIFLNHGRQISR
jgi:hypothetical protein